MKILMVARHGWGGNQDEDAIAFALEQLGCEVVRVQEGDTKAARSTRADLLLFLKWSDVECIRRIDCPKAFWYFDLVDYPDPALARRNAERRAWMESVVPVVDVGFLTDGDFVAGDKTGKLHWLPQGCDERVAGAGFPDPSLACDILFTGGRNGGVGRASFVDEMRAKYGDKFRHVEKGVHGRRLADLIASAKIVVAPDAPVTDRYASNRIYLTLGFGGFLLHPRCAALAAQYTDREEVVYYRDLHEQIDYYLRHPEERSEIAAAGLRRTLEAHTYRHRCVELLKAVHERLGVG